MFSEFPCGQCDFEAPTNKDLALHIEKKHLVRIDIVIRKENIPIFQNASVYDPPDDLLSSDKMAKNSAKPVRRKSLPAQMSSIDDEYIHDSQCRLCDYKTKSRHGMFLHNKSKHSGGSAFPKQLEKEGEELDIKCEQCDFVAKTKHGIVLHNKYKHQDCPSDESSLEAPTKILICHLCQFRTTVEDYMITHKMSKNHVERVKNYAKLDMDEYSSGLDNDAGLEDRLIEKGHSNAGNVQEQNQKTRSTNSTTKKRKNRDRSDAKANKVIKTKPSDLLVCKLCNYKTFHEEAFAIHKHSPHEVAKAKGHAKKANSNKTDSDQYRTIEEKFFMFCDHCPFKTQDMASMLQHAKLQHKPSEL